MSNAVATFEPDDAADRLLRQGAIDLDSGRLDEALDSASEALRHRPDSIQALYLHGIVLAKSNRAADGAAEFRRVIALLPAHPDSLNALAAVLEHSGDRHRAIVLFLRTVASVHQDAAAIDNLCTILLRAALPGLLSRWCRRAVALDPAHALRLLYLAGGVKDLGQLRYAATLATRAVAIRPNEPSAWSSLLFSLVYDPDIDEAALGRAYRRWAEIAGRHVKPRGSHNRNRDPDRRLRVGYLSADFREHAITYLVESLLEAHDRTAVEIFVYADVERPDDVTRRIMRLADGGRFTFGQQDEAVANAIDDDKIDVLVCLAGHTADNRVSVCTHRPSPIQVNLHDLSTSGLPQMGYWLTDSALHPADTEEFASERLYRLPSLYLHRPPEDAPDVEPVFSSASGRVVFGSFSNPAKINDAVLTSWGDILRRTPSSELRMGYRSSFSDRTLRSRIRDAIGRRGVHPAQLTFDDAAAGRRQHLRRLSTVDVVLDPFPFTGGTSTFEALWMGVPVVTLAGRRFAARCGVSHLRQVGLDDLIAEDVPHYVDIAVALAADESRRQMLRRTLRRRVETSRLCDAPTYARSIEAAYREMWRNWCRDGRGK
jgi:predicted O-linked N-acetylglucosamine transferase (SPINDLY family)